VALSVKPAILYRHALFLLLTVPMEISLPPYCTFMQRFNVRSLVVPEIVFDEKAFVTSHVPGLSDSHPPS